MRVDTNLHSGDGRRRGRLLPLGIYRRCLPDKLGWQHEPVISYALMDFRRRLVFASTIPGHPRCGWIGTMALGYAGVYSVFLRHYSGSGSVIVA